MPCRNALPVALALLLTGFAACTYNPSVHPDKLRCRDNNGCPSGYQCVGATDISLGFCCNKSPTEACFGPADGAAMDVRPTDAPAASPDGRNPQDLSSASEVRQGPDVNAADRPGGRRDR